MAWLMVEGGAVQRLERSCKLGQGRVAEICTYLLVLRGLSFAEKCLDKAGPTKMYI